MSTNPVSLQLLLIDTAQNLEAQGHRNAGQVCRQAKLFIETLPGNPVLTSEPFPVGRLREILRGSPVRPTDLPELKDVADLWLRAHNVPNILD